MSESFLISECRFFVFSNFEIKKLPKSYLMVTRSIHRFHAGIFEPSFAILCFLQEAQILNLPLCGGLLFDSLCSSVALLPKPVLKRGTAGCGCQACFRINPISDPCALLPDILHGLFTVQLIISRNRRSSITELMLEAVCIRRLIQNVYSMYTIWIPRQGKLREEKKRVGKTSVQRRTSRLRPPERNMVRSVGSG